MGEHHWSFQAVFRHSFGCIQDKLSGKPFHLFPIKVIALPCLISQQVSHILYYTSYVFLDLNRSFITYLFLLLLFMLYFSATRSQSSWCWYNTLLLLFNLVNFAFCIKILVTDTIWQSFQYCIFTFNSSYLWVINESHFKSKTIIFQII